MCLVKQSLQDSINKHFNKHRFWTNFLCANTLRELKLRTTYSGNRIIKDKRNKSHLCQGLASTNPASS